MFVLTVDNGVTPVVGLHGPNTGEPYFMCIHILYPQPRCVCILYFIPFTSVHPCHGSVTAQCCSQTYDNANQLLSPCSLVVGFQLGLI